MKEFSPIARKIYYTTINPIISEKFATKMYLKWDIQHKNLNQGRRLSRENSWEKVYIRIVSLKRSNKSRNTIRIKVLTPLRRCIKQELGLQRECMVINRIEYFLKLGIQ